MNRMTSCTLAGTVFALSFACAPVLAGDLGGGAGLPQPTLLRLTGFIGSAPQGTPTTLGAVTLGLDHTVTKLDLCDVQTLNGPLTEGRAALRQFDLYSPNILLVGDRALIAGISAAPAHSKISVWGYVMPGARRLLVVDVQSAANSAPRG
ncbi:MAG TPA: hypothetical protein VN812_22360 [Candidatus Acidoferrales bacterium]|nr:hypothetical protein [Candidatus Acidoferrales bacterium]